MPQINMLRASSKVKQKGEKNFHNFKIPWNCVHVCAIVCTDVFVHKHITLLVCQIVGVRQKLTTLWGVILAASDTLPNDELVSSHAVFTAGAFQISTLLGKDLDTFLSVSLNSVNTADLHWNTHSKSNMRYGIWGFRVKWLFCSLFMEVVLISSLLPE